MSAMDVDDDIDGETSELSSASTSRGDKKRFEVKKVMCHNIYVNLMIVKYLEISCCIHRRNFAFNIERAKKFHVT